MQGSRKKWITNGEATGWPQNNKVHSGVCVAGFFVWCGVVHSLVTTRWWGWWWIWLPSHAGFAYGELLYLIYSLAFLFFSIFGFSPCSARFSILFLSKFTCFLHEQEYCRHDADRWRKYGYSNRTTGCHEQTVRLLVLENLQSNVNDKSSIATMTTNENLKPKSWWPTR